VIIDLSQFEELDRTSLLDVNGGYVGTQGVYIPDSYVYANANQHYRDSVDNGTRSLGSTYGYLSQGGGQANTTGDSSNTYWAASSGPPTEEQIAADDEFNDGLNNQPDGVGSPGETGVIGSGEGGIVESGVPEALYCYHFEMGQFNEEAFIADINQKALDDQRILGYIMSITGGAAVIASSVVMATTTIFTAGTASVPAGLAIGGAFVGGFQSLGIGMAMVSASDNGVIFAIPVYAEAINPW